MAGEHDTALAASVPGRTVLALEPHPDGVALRVEAPGLSVLVPIARPVCARLGRRLVELAAAADPAPEPFPFRSHRTLADVAADEAPHA